MTAIEDWFLEDFDMDLIDVDDPISLTSEEDHAHDCPSCGGVWIHANDLCKWDGNGRSYITSPALCPECELA